VEGVRVRGTGPRTSTGTRPLLSPRSEDGVEEKSEGCERLRAMLHGKSEQDHVAHSGIHLDDGGMPGKYLLAFEPATEQHIFVAVARGVIVVVPAEERIS